MVAAEIWGPLGAILGACGIVVAGVLAWWFGRGPRLVMQVSGTTLVATPSDQRVSVHYKGQPVPRVTQSLVWLWREGRGTIRASDLVESDPISLRVPAGEQMLDATVVLQSRQTNNVDIVFDLDGGARVTFDYLDPRQGAVIEVLHTSATPEAVEAFGTIIGVPKGIQRVTEGVRVEFPVGIAGAVSVTVPTHAIPRSLRLPARAQTTRHIDLTPVGLLTTGLRRWLP